MSLRFEKSIHRTARICETIRSRNIDCGCIYRNERGGNIIFGDQRVPALVKHEEHSQPKTLCCIGFPESETHVHMGGGGSSSGGGSSYESDRIINRKTVESNYVAYAPSIVTADTFDYSNWDDDHKWLDMVMNRKISGNSQVKLQIVLNKTEDPGTNVVYLYYTTKDYVSLPSHWVPVKDTTGTPYPQMVPSPGGSRLRAANDFCLDLPGNGNYVLVCRYAEVNAELPGDPIDPDDYNQKDDWCFWEVSC